MPAALERHHKAENSRSDCGKLAKHDDCVANVRMLSELEIGDGLGEDNPASMGRHDHSTRAPTANADDSMDAQFLPAVLIMNFQSLTKLPLLDVILRWAITLVTTKVCRPMTFSLCCLNQDRLPMLSF